MGNGRTKIEVCGKLFVFLELRLDTLADLGFLLSVRPQGRSLVLSQEVNGFPCAKGISDRTLAVLCRNRCDERLASMQSMSAVPSIG